MSQSRCKFFRNLFVDFTALALLSACTASTPYTPEIYYAYYNDTPDDEGIIAKKYVHKYGVTVPRTQWEEGGQNGQVVTTTKDGVRCSQTYYCGALEGETNYTFPFSEAIEKVQIYSHGELTQEMTFYQRGQQRSEKIYHPQEPLAVREWYENGNLKSFEKYAGSLLSYGEYYDAKGQRLSEVDNGSGLKMMSDTYGVLWGADTIKEGEIVTRTTYYPNGSPKEVDPYKGEVVDGIRKTYYPGGEPRTQETWVNGKQDGITTLFADGEKSQEVPYRNGLKDGIGRIYRDGATVVQEVTWKEDLMHGPCKTYIDNRVSTEWYFKGKKVTKGYYDSFNFRPKPGERAPGPSADMSANPTAPPEAP